MCNKLSLNVKKSHYMLFNTRQTDANLIKINSFARVSKTKFLGVYIDDKLSWHDHISYVMSKVSRGVGILNKARRLLPLKVLNMLYCSLVLPHIQYCNIVWGSTYRVRLQPLFLLQKKAIRLVNNADYLAHTAPLFKSSRQLNLFDINKFQISMFVYKSLHNILPVGISSSILFDQGAHGHDTRHRSRLIVPRYKSTYRLFSIAVAGPKIQNSTDANIQNSKSVNSFKFRLKHSLLQNYS